MIDNLFNCLNSLNFYLILIIAYLLYKYKKRLAVEISKSEEQHCIDSIPDRSAECPQNYPNGWLPVYDGLDLKRGQVRAIFALGRDLILYRGTSGKAYVFDAYCPHLGANLGVGGTVVGDDIKCFFHGWQFNNQGDCKDIPGLEDKAIPKTSLKKWRCDEVNDFIYVWHHLEGKDPHWFISRLDRLDNLVYRGKLLVKTYCHIQDIAENEADYAHFNTVHGIDNFIPKFLQNIIKVNVNLNYWNVCDPPNSHCTEYEVVLALKIGSLTIAQASFVNHPTGPANIWFDVHLDIWFKLNFIITFDIITLGQLKQLTVFKCYSNSSILSSILNIIMFPSISSVFGQDVIIWNHKSYKRSPTLTKLDDTIIQVRRWYKQFYSDHLKDN